MKIRDLFGGGSAPTPSLAPSPREPVWMPAGATLAVHGHEIPGGLLYAGRGLRSISGLQEEPALIDPSLPVDWRRPDLLGRSMRYWPSYSEISPQARAAYLQWLIDGRRDPSTYIGYVFLFFYGLERRILGDGGLRADDQELDVIADEVRDLATVYGRSDSSFGRYALEFLDLMKSVALANSDLSPADVEADQRTWEVPLALRLGVARIAAQDKPLSAEWALAWIRHHPMGYLRVPAERCAGEFDALFIQCYREEYGEGIRLEKTNRWVRFDYRPASAGFGGAIEATLGNLPDVTWSESNLDELRAVGTWCADSLDSYSRYLGRHPDGRGTPQAAGLLPQPLVQDFGGHKVRELQSWLAALDDFDVVPLDDLLRPWATDFAGTKIGKSEAVAISSLLAKLGYGMEPDVRFGSPKPKLGEPAVIFRQAPDAPAAPSPEYTQASLLIRLSGLIATSDGLVSVEERRLLASHLEDTVGLVAAERRRVEASLIWIGAANLKMSGLKSKLENLPPAQKAIVGHFLVDVAMADGHVSPEEITTLTKLYRLLGLEEASVYSTVHAIETGDDLPVVVREGSPQRRHAIPQELVGVGIDRDRLAARQAETAQVAALLGEVFAEDESESPVSEPRPAPAAVTRFGLDAPHTAVLEALSSQDSWTRAELESLTSAHGLALVDAAVDRINDAVFEHCDEPFLEGEDPWELNHYAIETMA